MLGLLIVDLLLILGDNILMSQLTTQAANWLGVRAWLEIYQSHYHVGVAAVGGAFTLFWVAELLVRWALAIAKGTYYRWFFFPFVHWYEVLACFPALRALRLLRAAMIVRRLHLMGVQIIPKRWLNSGIFYYQVALEELSDRVLLTAVNNMRTQLAQPNSRLLKATLERNRDELENLIFTLLKKELTPKLHSAFTQTASPQLASDVGVAVEQALLDTPELRRYLKLIPIAGSLIENQITHVGKHIGENVTTAINGYLFDENTLNALMRQIAQGIVSIDTTRPELQKFVCDVVTDALDAFEAQIKIQQWKHKQDVGF
ncbi:hypothetical protein B0181_04100 [Moraxella caviae]|nr:hypothetical protein B0181_04100 [Moraxella caviae]